MRKYKFNLKTILIILLIAACVAVGTMCVIKAVGNIKYNTTIADSKIIDESIVTIIADATSGTDYPENTTYTADDLIINGFTKIKIDVRLTENKEWVCLREDDISSVTDGIGSISSMTYYEALNYNVNVGEKVSELLNPTIQTMEQVVSYCYTNGLFPVIFIHDYDEEAITELMKYLYDNSMTEGTVIASDNIKILKCARESDKFCNCWYYVDRLTDKSISACNKQKYTICFNALNKKNTRENISKLDSYSLDYACYGAEKLKTIEKFYKFGVRQFVTSTVKPIPVK